MKSSVINRFIVILALILTLPFHVSATSNTSKEFLLTSSGETKEYISATIRTENDFTGLITNYELIKSQDDSVYFAFRFRNNNSVEYPWSEWVEINTENEDGPTLNQESKQSTLINSNLSNEYQYKVVLEAGQDKILPNFSTYDPEFLNIEASPKKISFKDRFIASLSSDATNPELNVISRANWGANEDLLFYADGYEPNEEDKDNNDEDEEMTDSEKEYWEEIQIVKESEGDRYYKWPLEYIKDVKMIVIHHTASVKNLDDPKTAIRNIQYYHAVRRGWGDIGYNYVIDPEGNIYEGRRGGEKVVGGHAIPVNRASIGISVMGNFQSQALPKEVVESIVKLTRAKAELYNLDLNGRLKYKGVNYNVLQGHRDNSPTACPGENLYIALPSIRYLAMKGNGDTADSLGDENLSYLSANPLKNITNLDPYSSKSITIKLLNIGKETWTQSHTFIELNAEDKLTYSKAVDLDKKYKMTEKSIGPGETASFKIKLEALLKGGYHGLKLDVSLNNKAQIESPLYLPIFINPADLSYKITKKDTANSKTIILKTGESKTLSFSIKNTGDIPWNKSGLELGLYTNDLKNSKIAKSRNELVSDLSGDLVKPGEDLDFKIKLKAPTSSGTYSEAFLPRIKGIDWLEGEDIKVKLKVVSPTISKSDSKIQKVLLQVFPIARAEESEINIENGDSTKLPRVKVFIKELSTVSLEIENKSDDTWQKDSLDIELLAGKKGMGPNKFSKIRLAEQSVKPGNVGHIIFKVYPRNYGAFEYEMQITDQVEKFKVLAAEKKDELEELSEEGIWAEDGVTTEASSPEIRVLLSFFDKDEAVVSSQSAFRIELDGKIIGNSEDSEDDEDSNDGLLVQKSDSELKLRVNSVSYDGDILRLVSEEGQAGVFEIENYEHRPSWKKSLNDNKFRGVLELRVDNDELVIINELELESYLKGLAEISNSANSEKMKTIIVAARSYAFHYITEGTKFPGKAWNLDDDPEHSQKYLGYGFETRAPRVVESIEDTFGKVVSYEDKVIKVPYFNQSDGRTRSAKEVWGWEAPYLISVEDTFCESDELLGHGVGISGCGATEMAKKGMDHEEIIQYFLTGVNFKYVYTRD